MCKKILLSICLTLSCVSVMCAQARKNNTVKSDSVSAADIPLILVMTTEEGAVEVSWVSPVSDAIFTIQRGIDGVNFTDLYRITNVSKNMNGYFSIKDNAPLKGISYYRVKQTSPENVMAFSGIDKVTILSPGNISVTKNYRTGNYMIDFISSATESYTFEITNSANQVVFTQKLENFSGTYSKEMDLSIHGKNIYFITATGSSGKIIKRVVVY